MWIEEAIGLGLGYLVYKQIQTNVTDTPINITPMPTPQAGQLISWDTPADFQAGIDKWASGNGLDLSAVLGTDIPQQAPAKPFELPEGAEWGIPPPMDFGLGTGITRLTFKQVQEIGGPSRTGLTRPKGLD
jgi:hypothetical protein